MRRSARHAAAKAAESMPTESNSSDNDDQHTSTRQALRMTDVAYTPQDDSPRRSTRLRTRPRHSEPTDALLERELAGVRRIRTGKRGRPRKADYGLSGTTAPTLPPAAAAAMAAANAAYVARDYGRAKSALEEVVRLCPRSAEAYVTLGMVHEETGLLSNAMTAYNFAIQAAYNRMRNDPNVLYRLARLSLILLINELSILRASPTAPVSGGIAPGAAAPSAPQSSTPVPGDPQPSTTQPSARQPQDSDSAVLSALRDVLSETQFFAVSPDLELIASTAADDSQAQREAPPFEHLTPAERVSRRQREAAHYLGPAARVLRDPRLYWTRARIMIESGNVWPAIDGLSILFTVVLVDAPDSACATLAAIETLSRRMLLPQTAAQVADKGLERALAGQRRPAPLHTLRDASKAVASALWMVAQGGLHERVVGLVGAFGGRVSAEESIADDAEWFILTPDQRRTRALATLPPDVLLLGHVSAIVLSANADGMLVQSDVIVETPPSRKPKAATIPDETLLHTLAQPATPHVLSSASPRIVVLYARVLLYLRHDAANALAALIPVLSERPNVDESVTLEASILVAHAYRTLSREAPDTDTAMHHLRSAHASLQAVLGVAPARQDACQALAAVCALLGDNCLPPPPSTATPAPSLFRWFAPLPGEPPIAGADTPLDSAVGTTDTNALFDSVWSWPATSSAEDIPLDSRLFTGSLNIRSTRTEQGSDNDASDSDDDGQRPVRAARTSVQRRRKRTVARSGGIASAARTRIAADVYASLVALVFGSRSEDSPNDALFYTGLASLPDDALGRVAVLAQTYLDGSARSQAAAATTAAHRSLVALAYATARLGDHAKAADALWTRAIAAGDHAMRVYGSDSSRAAVLRLLHVSLCVRAANATGRCAVFSRRPQESPETPDDDVGENALLLTDGVVHETGDPGDSDEAANASLLGRIESSARWALRHLKDRSVAAETAIAVLSVRAEPMAAGDPYVRVLRRAATDTPITRAALLAFALHGDRPDAAVEAASAALGEADGAAGEGARTCLAAALAAVSMRRQYGPKTAARVRALRVLWDSPVTLCLLKDRRSEMDSSLANAHGSLSAPEERLLYNHARLTHGLGAHGIAAMAYRRVIRCGGALSAAAAYNMHLLMLDIGADTCAARDILMSSVLF